MDNYTLNIDVYKWQLSLSHPVEKHGPQIGEKTLPSKDENKFLHYLEFVDMCIDSNHKSWNMIDN